MATDCMKHQVSFVANFLTPQRKNINISFSLIAEQSKRLHCHIEKPQNAALFWFLFQSANLDLVMSILQGSLHCISNSSVIIAIRTSV